ncbi:MAG: flagellar hook-associated protein FlgK [Gammaproteobacteria bacterium]|nr:flagellar hook-associated protein FlgK [Gammaproteobacteria bacterium]
MAELYNIGISALLSTQRALTTTGHNIANVNTAGYTRQRVSLEALVPHSLGGMFFGSGVAIRGVERVADQFMVSQIRSHATSEQQEAVLYELTAQVSDLLADDGAGLSPALQQYFGALQDLNSDPASTTARMVLLHSAELLTDRFHTQYRQLQAFNTEVNHRLEAGVERINALAQSIARINDSITSARAVAGGAEPNDLLDQREQLLTKLAEQVNVTVIEQSDGQLNVTIGSGQLIVAGSTALALTTRVDADDAARLDLAYANGGTDIAGAITGGQLGGVLRFRREVLEPALNDLGRIAATLAQGSNVVHRAGMDLHGALGGDLFALGEPQLLSAPANSGSVTVAFDEATVGALTAADYRLEYTGSAFQLTNLASNEQTTLSGTGPFTVAGVTITVAGAPAAGDSYLLRPTRLAARNIELVVRDPARLALAAPNTTAASVLNLGSGAISGAEVRDASDPTLLVTTNLVFNDPPTTYQINGAGPLLPYTADAAIDLNGWRVRISGTPVAGDRFTVSANTAGIGDNSNGLRLSSLQAAPILSDGTASLSEAYSSLVGSAGMQARRAEVAHDAMLALRDNAIAQREQTAGVNLDEEAANLLEYQQIYQAAARMIQIGNDNITALMNVLR